MSAIRAVKCWMASSLICCSRSRSRSRRDTDSDCCTIFSRSRRLAIIRSCLSKAPRSLAPCSWTQPSGSSESWLNHWLWFDLSTCDLIWISFNVIWFGDLNESQLSIIWPRNNDYFVGVFTVVELNLISVIVPSLIFAETLTLRPDIHWWHFAYILESGTVVIWLT